MSDRDDRRGKVPFGNDGNLARQYVVGFADARIGVYHERDLTWIPNFTFFAELRLAEVDRTYSGNVTVKLVCDRTGKVYWAGMDTLNRLLGDRPRSTVFVGCWTFARHGTGTLVIPDPTVPRAT